MRNRFSAVSLFLPLCTACAVDEAFAHYFDQWGDSTESASAATTIEADTGPISTNSGSPGEDSLAESTIGAGSGDASSTGTIETGDDGARLAPLFVEIEVEEAEIKAVGEVAIHVHTSRPVQSLELRLDGEVLALPAVPAPPVHTIEVTSEFVPGNATYVLHAIGHAADGAHAEDVQELRLDVPPGGTDFWEPYVQTGPINGFTDVVLLGDEVVTAGFFDSELGLEAVVTRIDAASGAPIAPPLSLGEVAVTTAGRGPSIAAAEDGQAVFVAWTRPHEGSTQWAVSRIEHGEPAETVWLGEENTSVNALAVVDGTVIIAGALENSPSVHDLKVWWISAASGKVLHDVTFVGPEAQSDVDELARGVAIVDDELVVVGERMSKEDNQEWRRRTVLLRFDLEGALLEHWTSPGELMEEDGGMAVAPLRAGGFVVTGWGRNTWSAQRLLLTRWFTAEGEPSLPRIEPSTADAVGHAIGEDREGKLVVAGTLEKPLAGGDAWIFAIPGPEGAPVWEVIRNGPGHGPDEAVGLAVDEWGYSYVVGSEFAVLQPRAFMLCLNP